MEFEWNLAKELRNLQKHGIHFASSVETFNDPFGIKLRDTKHSHKEERCLWIGTTQSGEVLTTWFVIRNDVIRIIGCAKLRKFKKVYYDAIKNRTIQN